MFQSQFQLCRLRLVARVALSLGMSGAPYIIRATQTTPYVYVYICIHSVYTYIHCVWVIRGQCVSTHESTPSLLLYKSPTPKHLLIIQIIQNKINVAKKHREVENTRNQQASWHTMSDLLIIEITQNKINTNVRKKHALRSSILTFNRNLF